MGHAAHLYLDSSYGPGPDAWRGHDEFVVELCVLHFFSGSVQKVTRECLCYQEAPPGPAPWEPGADTHAQHPSHPPPPQKKQSQTSQRKERSKGQAEEGATGGAEGKHASPHTRAPPPQPTRPRMSCTLPGTAKPKTTPKAPPQRTTMRSRRGRHTTHRRQTHGRHRHKPHPHNPPHPPLRRPNTQWCPHGCGTPQKPPSASRPEATTGRTKGTPRNTHPQCGPDTCYPPATYHGPTPHPSK